MLFGKNGKPSAEKLAAAAAEFYGDANKNKADKPAEGAVKDAVVSETEQKDAFIEPEQPGGDSAPEEEAVEYGTYERYIAEELLMKYENSKAYREGSSSRKIAVRVDQLIEIEDDLENEDEKVQKATDIVNKAWRKMENPTSSSDSNGADGLDIPTFLRKNKGLGSK